MDRCKHVVLVDNACSHKLKEIERHYYKLNVIEGEIISCEPDSRGLVIKLDDHTTPSTTKDKEIIWDYGGKFALPAICGQNLRCFYEEENEGNIHVDAWELMKQGGSGFVLRRATRPNVNYKFIDSE